MSDRPVAFSPTVFQYILAIGLRETPELAALRDETAQMPNETWATTPEQVALLRVLVRFKRAKKVLEIGTFTGHATLGLALGVGENGKVITCDVAPGWSEVGQRFWRAAKVDSRIDQRIGRARESMEALLAEGEEGTFDLVFLDADRGSYGEYLPLIFRLLSRGGLLVADDVLGSGEFAEDGDDYGETQALRAFNGALHEDERFELAMLPIARGMTLAVKK